ncbi:MAG TPA: serine hydrolase [Gemmatimonadaceae bacterium]|nr:serine hydrolase [Gemmatimonadaceae bacterium]
MLSLLFAAANLFHPLTPSVPLPTGDGLPAKAPSAVGMSAARLATIDRVVERGIRAGGYPGAAVVVGRKGAAVWEKGFGRLGWTGDAGSVVPERTIYDLASLTKVVGTTTAVMILYDEGKIRLDDRVVQYIPEFGGGAKDFVTIRMLLEHRSGLPAGRDLWRLASTPAEARAAVISTPLFAAPGHYVEYSDLGADVLGFIVEAVSGEGLDRFLDTRVFGPLGMTDTRFRPDGSLRGRIAPTELNPPRGYPLRGEVHDENAYALGGVAGHAGLFSTASDLAVFAQMLLNGGSYNGTRIVADSTVRIFTRRAASTRALGWDTCGGKGSCGTYLSPSAYGHTGFTGTSLWIDPEREMFVVLLTNRVHAAKARRPAKVISDVRADLADAAALAVTDSHTGILSMPASFRADRAVGWNRPVYTRSRSARSRRAAAARSRSARASRSAKSKVTARSSKSAGSKASARKTASAKRSTSAKRTTTAKKKAITAKKSTTARR